jgi:pyruvate,water dikinase
VVCGDWTKKLAQGTATPDEFFVFKPALLKGKNAIVQKRPGEKKTIIYGTGENKDVINMLLQKKNRSSLY